MRLQDMLSSTALQRPVQGPVWLKKRFKFSDFTAASTTNSLVAFTLPPSCGVHAAFIKHSVAFAGPAVTAATLELGVLGSLTLFANAFSVFGAPSSTNFSAGGVTNGFTMSDALNPVSVLATLITTGANTSVLTAGYVEIGLLVSEIPGGV